MNENSAFVGGVYDLTDRIGVFGNFLFGSSASDVVNVRGNPELEDPYFATIYSGNPYLPAAVQAEMTAKNVASIKVNKLGQFPGLSNYNQSESARNVRTMRTWSVGAEADLTDNWHLKGTWQSGRSRKPAPLSYGEVRTDRIFLALDAVRDPVTKQIVCNVTLANPSPAQIAAATQAAFPGKKDKYGQLLQTPIGLDNSIAGCVPINIFGQGNVSQLAQDYVTGNKWGVSVVKQDFAEALLTGKLFDGWAGEINSALGATYRSESLVQQAYPIDLDHAGPPEPTRARHPGRAARLCHGQPEHLRVLDGAAHRRLVQRERGVRRDQHPVVQDRLRSEPHDRPRGTQLAVFVHGVGRVVQDRPGFPGVRRSTPARHAVARRA